MKAENPGMDLLKQANCDSVLDEVLYSEIPLPYLARQGEMAAATTAGPAVVSTGGATEVETELEPVASPLMRNTLLAVAGVGAGVAAIVLLVMVGAMRSYWG